MFETTNQLNMLHQHNEPANHRGLFLGFPWEKVDQGKSQ